MLLSALFVRYRDVQPIWDVVMMAAFYATPILYPLEAVQIEWAQELIMCNPLAVVVAADPPRDLRPVGCQRGRGDRRLGPADDPARDRHRDVVFGLWYFNRAAPDVAENL